MTAKNSQSKLLLTILPLIGILIGSFLTYMYGIRAQRVERWNDAKLDVYSDYVRTYKKEPRFTIAFIGGQEVIQNLFEYVKIERVDPSNTERKHKAILKLFRSMRDELSPHTKEKFSDEAIKWILFPEEMSKKACPEAQKR